MLRRYGDKALEESGARADELAAQDDYDGAAIWRRITAAVGQLSLPRPDYITNDSVLCHSGDRLLLSRTVVSESASADGKTIVVPCYAAIGRVKAKEQITEGAPLQVGDPPLLQMV